MIFLTNTDVTRDFGDNNDMCDLGEEKFTSVILVITMTSVKSVKKTYICDLGVNNDNCDLAEENLHL